MREWLGGRRAGYILKGNREIAKDLKVFKSVLDMTNTKIFMSARVSVKDIGDFFLNKEIPHNLHSWVYGWFCEAPERSQNKVFNLAKLSEVVAYINNSENSEEAINTLHHVISLYKPSVNVREMAGKKDLNAGYSGRLTLKEREEMQLILAAYKARMAASSARR